MEASELRIGNYIQVDDLPIEQVTLETFKTLYENPHHISKFNGVILSPEILEACGFEKHNECWIYKGLKLWVSDEGTMKSTFYHINSELLTYISSVHQLQNFYFMVCSEELEINSTHILKNSVVKC